MILRTKDKNRITQLANQTLETPLEIWAYGSRVNGQAHDCSDLDLVIRTKNKQPLDIKQLADFQDALSQSNIPFIVQVFDWYKLPKSFQKNILQQYEVLYYNFSNI